MNNSAGVVSSSPPEKLGEYENVENTATPEELNFLFRKPYSTLSGLGLLVAVSTPNCIGGDEYSIPSGFLTHFFNLSGPADTDKLIGKHDSVEDLSAFKKFF